MPQLSFHTVLGVLSLAEENGVLVSVDWGFARDQDATALLKQAREEVFAYLAGGATGFTLPHEARGTPYQRRVWAALAAIPYGQTRTYADIAGQVGGSPRSVGGASGRNPLPILIPCHRVVATAGLGGYSGGEGLATKRALLTLERAAPSWPLPGVPRQPQHASPRRSAA